MGRRFPSAGLRYHQPATLLGNLAFTLEPERVPARLTRAIGIGIVSVVLGFRHWPVGLGARGLAAYSSHDSLATIRGELRMREDLVLFSQPLISNPLSTRQTLRRTVALAGLALLLAPALAG